MDDLMLPDAFAWMSPDGKTSKTQGELFYYPLYTADQMREYARKAVEAEREACARVCEALVPFGPEPELQKATAEDCAYAIRARR